MNKKIFSLFVLLLSIFMTVFLITSCSTVVARADGIEISQKEVDKYINFLKSQGGNVEVPETAEELKQLEVNIIDSLIVLKLIGRYAEENNIAVPEEEINDQLDLIIETYPSEQDFDADLESKGVDRDFLVSELKGQLLRERVFVKETLNVIVTTEQAKAYYQENKETLFKIPEKIKVSHILAIFPWVEVNGEETEEGRKEALDKIEYIKEKIDDGEDFETIAIEFSDDTATKENGGDLGYISRSQMVEEFDKEAFSLDVGEISNIVETVYGYHIIKAVDFQEEYIKDFEDVEETINEYLLNQVKVTKWEDFILSLIEVVDIEYLTDIEGELNDEDLGQPQEESPPEDETDTNGTETEDAETDQ